MKYPAIQIKGPGEAEVAGSMVKFYIGGEVVASLDTSDERYDTMGKICSSIQFNPLVFYACAIANKPYERIEPLPELIDHQSYLIALKGDASCELLEMDRMSCSGEAGITLYANL